MIFAFRENEKNRFRFNPNYTNPVEEEILRLYSVYFHSHFFYVSNAHFRIGRPENKENSFSSLTLDFFCQCKLLYIENTKYKNR
jgi:hypothetical protein